MSPSDKSPQYEDAGADTEEVSSSDIPLPSLQQSSTSIDMKESSISSTASTTELTPPPQQPTFPEGGYGWVIAICGSMVIFVGFGQINTFGIYFTYYEEKMFPNESTSILALIGAVQGALLFIPGLFAGHIIGKFGPRCCLLVVVYVALASTPILALIGAVQGALLFIPGLFAGHIIGKFGPRAVSIAGSLIIVFSCFMVGISTEVWHLFLSQGILAGIGYTLCYYPWMALPNQYFFKKRATAIAIVVSGSSLGGTIVPIMMQQLFDIVGFRKANFILGCVSFVLLITPNILMKQRTAWRVPARLFDKNFLHTPYLFLIAAMSLTMLGFFTPYSYITSYALYKGVDSSLAFYLLSIMNGASLFGRILPGILADKVGRFNVLFFGCTISGILALAMWLPINTSGEIVAFSVLIGFFSGSIISMMTPAIAQISEVQFIPQRIGFLCFICGAPILVGTPISGAILNHNNGDYDGLIIFTGVTLLGAGVCTLLARLSISRKLLHKV